MLVAIILILLLLLLTSSVISVHTLILIRIKIFVWISTVPNATAHIIIVVVVKLSIPTVNLLVVVSFITLRLIYAPVIDGIILLLLVILLPSKGRCSIRISFILIPSLHFFHFFSHSLLFSFIFF